MSNNRRMDRRRDAGRRGNDEGIGLKGALYIIGIVLVIGVIAFFVTNMIYNKNLDNLYDELEPTEIGDSTIIDNSKEMDTEEASSGIGKTIEEQMAEMQEVSVENEEVSEVSTREDDLSQNRVAEETKETKAEETEPVKDPEFIAPVAGGMIKEFAKDKLVYSETLKEWVTHTGVDIMADKTTVVKTAEAGKVTAIKNDPRYGITVIIQHANGYETRYANLLTAEFVNVGEEVAKDQTIGTVGNTATFEVLDESHLHFEILKDGEYLDPAIFIEL